MELGSNGIVSINFAKAQAQILSLRNTLVQKENRDPTTFFGHDTVDFSSFSTISGDKALLSGRSSSQPNTAFFALNKFKQSLSQSSLPNHKSQALQRINHRSYDEITSHETSDAVHQADALLRTSPSLDFHFTDDFDPDIHDPKKDATLDNAEAQLLRATKNDPLNQDAYLKLGTTYQLQQEFEKALAAINEAQRIAPSSESFNNKGVLLEQEGELLAALSNFEAAIAGDPFEARALNNIGRLSLEAGDIEGARFFFDLAIEHNPRDPAAYFNQGKLFEDEGFDVLAHILFNKAFHLTSDNKTENIKLEQPTKEDLVLAIDRTKRSIKNRDVQ